MGAARASAWHGWRGVDPAGPVRGDKKLMFEVAHVPIEHHRRALGAAPNLCTSALMEVTPGARKSTRARRDRGGLNPRQDEPAKTRVDVKGCLAWVIGADLLDRVNDLGGIAADAATKIVLRPMARCRARTSAR